MLSAFQPDQSAYGLNTASAVAAVMISCLVIAGPGCAVSPTAHKYANEIHPREDVIATPQRIRLRMRALAQPLSGILVASADRIIAGTNNPGVRREALLWKLEGVPAIREALFRPDPYVAVVDIWGLTWQMTDYFESGRGKQELGVAAPMAGSTCQDLEYQLNTVAASLTDSGDVSDVREFARQWARKHPIQHSIGGRESVVSLAAERQLPERFSAEHVAGDAVVTLDDLTRRLDVYSVQLFDQARWQAELVAMDVASQYELGKAMPLAEGTVQAVKEAVAILKRLEPALGETLAVAKSMPEVISRERAAALESVTKERVATLAYVTSEREAAMSQVTKERQALMTELRETIAAEHKGLMDDAEQMSVRVVDHAMLRVGQLSALTLAFVFVGLVVLLFVTRLVFTARPKDPSRARWAYPSQHAGWIRRG